MVVIMRYELIHDLKREKGGRRESGRGRPFYILDTWNFKCGGSQIQICLAGM